jgi:DNA helicase-2/ATP-dependent DNA helicase PcrA
MEGIIEPMNLNHDQKSVVEHIEGPIMVMAPAGSGKTAMLALRIEQAFKAGFQPEEMLCLTFTNLAARQLRLRVEQAMPERARQIWMSTFHGFCTLLLRMEAGRVGLPGDFVIYDEDDSAELMARLMREHKLDQIDNPDSHTAKDKYLKATDILQCLEKCKSRAEGDALSLAGFAGEGLEDERLSRLCQLYSKALTARHAFDFADLIYYARALFHQHRDLREKWAHRFQFIQVDEIQDTHLAEYSVIRTLAAARNIAIYGDLDQSIYGWRGSTPFRVRDHFLRDFEPAVYGLPMNYRATRMLIGAADSFAQRAYSKRCTRLVPAPSCPQGRLVMIHQAADEEAEGRWIGGHIQKHTPDSKGAFRNIAVLCRSNKKADELGKILSDMAIPCITAEQYNFFRRQEIKDAVAFLRLLLNPYDVSSAQRIMLRHVGGVAEGTVQRIIEEGEAAGIRLPDLLREETFVHNDPFGHILHACESGRVVVLDTETTGLSSLDDAVIELACIQLDKGEVTGEWTHLLRSERSVGRSVQVHGISDEMLLQDGADPVIVLQALYMIMPGSLIVGHNVSYDLSMIQAQSSRLGLEVPPYISADTCELARRFLKAESFRLTELCAGLGLQAGVAHRALGDVQSTVSLLRHLVPEMKKDQERRRALISRYREKFAGMATLMTRFRTAAKTLRPHQLMKEMIDTLGLMATYQGEPVRQDNLRRLVSILAEHDSKERSPWEELKGMVQFASLAKHLDQLSDKDNKVIVAPVHQSKGLEFDTVFIAGAVDGVMPHYYATDHEEERRLFYVAMTRPKVALYISGFRTMVTPGGRIQEKKMTPYIQYIAPECVEFQGPV